MSNSDAHIRKVLGTGGIKSRKKRKGITSLLTPKRRTPKQAIKSYLV